MPELPQIVNFISGVGFPIAVATYLLLRLETRLTELRDVVQELSKGLERHINLVEAVARQRPSD